MTKEDQILAKLEALTVEVAEAKKAIRPYQDFKETMEPIINAAVLDCITKLDSVGGRINSEDLSELATESLASAGNLTEGLRMLNGAMEFKKTAAPIVDQAFQDVVAGLDTVKHRFDMGEVQELVHQSLLNIGNFTELLKVLGAAMDLKDTAADFPRVMIDDLTEKLEDFRVKGGFDGIANLTTILEKMAIGMGQVDLSKAKPISGLFGMLGALKRPDVQQGLGVAIELAGALAAVKK
ncbi:MAG: DUF1641 domain-containing protein [SAR324 cluster bacterium]|nr:DUF1641 domain-containing protein [SAR324 cluster bacterium]